MECVIIRIVARHDAADDLAISLGQEKRSVAVLVKRVPFAIEKSFPLEDQWRDPGWIVPINPPGKPDESVLLLSTANW